MNNNNNNDNQNELEEEHLSNHSFSFQFKKELNIHTQNNKENYKEANTNSSANSHVEDINSIEHDNIESPDTRNLIFKHSQPFSFELIDKKIEHDTQRHYKNYDILDVVDDLSHNLSDATYSHYSKLKSLEKENQQEKKDTLFDNNEYEKEEINEFEEQEQEQEDSVDTINHDSSSRSNLDNLSSLIKDNHLDSTEDITEQELKKQENEKHTFSALNLNPIEPIIEDTKTQVYLKKSYLHLKDIAIGTSIFTFTSITCAFLIGMFTFSSPHYQNDPNFEPIVQVQPPIVQNNSMNNINIRANPFNNLAYTMSQVPHFSSLSTDNQVSLLNSLINFKQYQTFNQLLDKQNVSSVVLSEILGTYNSIFTSDPEYFNAFQKLLAAGADWKQDQFLFLKQTASSKDWRDYWIHYFNKNQPDMLPVYAYIIRESIGPEAEPVLNSIN